MPEVPVDTPLQSITSSGSPKLEVTSSGQLDQLQKSMADFFGPELEKAEGNLPPATPPTPPATEPKPPETVPKPPETTPKPPETAPKPPETGTPPEPKAPPADPDLEPDDELDKFQVATNVKPEIGEQFKNLRGKAKEQKRLAQQFQKELETTKKEIEELRKSPSQLPTEITSELEELRTFRRTNDIAADPAFKARFDTPISALENDVCNLIQSTDPTNAELKAYVEQMRQIGPRNIAKNWWGPNVIKNLGDEFTTAELQHKLLQIYDLQKQRGTELESWSKDGEAYKQHQQTQIDSYWKQYALDAAAEVKAMRPELGEFGVMVEPKDENVAKTPEERAQIVEHNTRRKPYEEAFQKNMVTAYDGGARGMARVCALATQSMWLQSELEARIKELGEVRDELSRTKSQLDGIMQKQKIGGSRGTAPAPGTTGPPKKVGGSVADAFKQHESIFMGGGNK